MGIFFLWFGVLYFLPKEVVPSSSLLGNDVEAKGRGFDREVDGFGCG